MPYFTQQDTDDHTDQSADLLPVRAAQPAGLVVSPDDWNPVPTSPYGPHGASYGPAVAQHAYLQSALPAHALERLLGPPEPPLPRVFEKTNRIIQVAGRAHLLPGLGVLTMAGLSAWAHSEPYHPLIGGSLITVGGFLIHSGIAAHRRHGTDADPMFTKGAAAAGTAAAIIGTGVTAGLGGWSALAFGAGAWIAYGAAAAVRHSRHREDREFAVALVAAGNTGPALAPMPLPPSPWGGPVSDEEYRLRRAFDRINGPEVILSPVRRRSENTWTVIANLIDTKLTVEEVIKAAPKLASFAGARRVEALPDQPAQVRLIIHDGEDPLEEPITGPGPLITSILDAVPFGLFEDATDITQLLAWNHVLIAGATDNGKSGVLDDIIIGTLACRDLVRIGVDCKAGAPAFGVYRPIMFHLAETPEEGMRVFNGLEAVYEYRGKLLEEKGLPSEENEDGIPVRRWSPEFGPFILAPIDELAELTSKIKGAAARIQSLNALVRYVGIIRIDATQTPSKQVFGGTTDARLNYQVRIGVRTTESTANNIIMGPGSHGRGWRLDLLDLPGKLMVQSRQHDRPRVGRGHWYTDARIARYVAEYRNQVSDLDDGSKDAFWEGYHRELQLESGGGDGGPRGGRRPEPEDSAPVHYGRPQLVIVPTYPDDSEVEEKDRALWRLLGEFGAAGATRKELAAKAEARGHQYKSPAWVQGRLDFWRERQYVGFAKDGRETRHWRTDLAVDQRKDA
jgi:hypothetical protein